MSSMLFNVSRLCIILLNLYLVSICPPRRYIAFLMIFVITAQMFSKKISPGVTSLGDDEALDVMSPGGV